MEVSLDPVVDANRVLEEEAGGNRDPAPTETEEAPKTVLETVVEKTIVERIFGEFASL